MEDEALSEDVDDPLRIDEMDSACEIPVMHITRGSDKPAENVEYIRIEPHEVVNYSDTVVTLLDGTIRIEIPVSEGKSENETKHDEATVLKIEGGELVEGETLIFEDEASSYEEHEVFILEDGRIAFIQPVLREGNVNSDEIQNSEKEGDPEKTGTRAANKSIKKKEKSFFCKVPGCERGYSSLHHLKVHSRNHTGDRPYKCSVEGCSKAFATDYSRKAHLRTHTGEKPYPCPSENCFKSFKTSGDLQKHIRIHTGERPFVCPIKDCNRSFTTSNIRKVHIRTHTGEKPYECTYEGCNRSFASSTNFKNHMRIHSGEKPYCCPLPNCLKRFTEYSSLYKHQLVHSQLKRHPCPYCHKTYRQSSTLVTHKRTIHGLISADDGTEIILEQMIGVWEDGCKNFKNITSKLLNMKQGRDQEVTVAEGNAVTYTA